MAPANRASMAEGPALKLVHCTLTCGPIALSNHPLALPTIACACVTLGKAPTRMVFALPWAGAETDAARLSASPNQKNLFPFVAPDDHGENAARFFFLRAALCLATFSSMWSRPLDQLRQGCVFQDFRGSISHVKEHLIQGAMRQVAVDQSTQLIGVAEGRQGSVNQANNLTEVDFIGIAAQLIAALGTADALHNAGIFQFQENQFQKFFRKALFISDVANLDGTLVVVARQHHHRLQRVQSLLRNFHEIFRSPLGLLFHRLHRTNRLY